MADTPRMMVSKEQDVIVVELMDRKILDEVSIMQIGEQIGGLIADELNPRLLVDFSNVGHLSSSALGLLLKLRKQIREMKGTLALCNIQPQIYEVFTITRLNEMLTIKDSRSEALAAMQ
jgi:anti-sigma B factor antagonist